jgi:hypothetical protein
MSRASASGAGMAGLVADLARPYRAWHRLHTIRGADSIIVLHDGIVVEQGRHEELLARGRIYADLYMAKPAAPAESEVAWHAP